MLRGKALLLAVTFMTLGLYSRPIWAKFAISDRAAPIERLITNVTAYVKAHPEDANAYYTLGRVYALAYAAEGGQIEVTPAKEDGALPTFDPHRSVQDASRGADEPLKDGKRILLTKSLENYKKATELDAKKGLYWLGYGWMLQQAHLHKIPDPNKRDFRAEALAAYKKAFDLTHDADAQSKAMSYGDAHVSIVAARSALELLNEMPDSADKKTAVAAYEGAIREFEKTPRPITPIVFPLDRDRPLASLIDNSKTVNFDLAGGGSGEKWPWVRPDTGILTWDPHHTGRITSGRQLFGSVTWWIFWQDGYQPLAMLDDDRDGSLTGDELKGLAVWVDRNTDGVSDPGEVVPLESAGITRISTQSRRINGVLQSPGGVIFRDGRTVSSYDWEPTSRD